MTGGFHRNIEKTDENPLPPIQKSPNKAAKKAHSCTPGTLFPYCRHWDLKPQDDMPHDWHGNASQYQRYPWRRILCGGKGGGSLRCRCAIRQGKVLLQRQQGAAELERNRVSTCFRAAIVDLWMRKMETTLDLIFFCTHIFNVVHRKALCSSCILPALKG